jgi:hypothetical protein
MQKVKSKYKKWQPIEIFWLDSIHCSKWRYEEEADDLVDDRYLHHKTIGYFFKETPVALSVIQSKSDDGEEKANIDAIMSIPKVAILKIRRIL